MTTALLFHDKFLEHATGPLHPERPERLQVILRELEAVGLREAVEWPTPEAAPLDWIQRVHDDSVVDRVRRLSESGGGAIDPDTVVSPASSDAAVLAAGAAVEATRLVLSGEADNVFALVRRPRHHAERARSMGFCLFNNVAVAAEWALNEGGARRVAIVDPDVHHGNGTQEVFYDRGDVLYVSLHQSPLYPGTGAAAETGAGAGAGFTVNLPVPAGTGEEAYRGLLDDFVLTVLDQFDPDLLFVSAGYDAHHRDPIGGLRLGSAFYGEMFSRFREACPRLVACLEGGYDLRGLSEGVAHSVGALADRPVGEAEAPPPGAPVPTHVLDGFRRALAPFWTLSASARSSGGGTI